MNVKYNSEKPKKAKIIKIFNLSSKPIKRHNSLHKIYSSEKENINIINNAMTWSEMFLCKCTNEAILEF